VNRVSAKQIFQVNVISIPIHRERNLMFLRDFLVEDSFEMTDKLFCRNSNENTRGNKQQNE